MTNEQLAKIADAFEKHTYDDLKHFSELAESLRRIEELQQAQVVLLNETIVKMKPMTEAWDGLLFSKKFIIGFSTVILAVGAIGAGVIWLVNAAINK